MTVGLPASVAAITEFVVPRSIPTAVAIVASSPTARRFTSPGTSLARNSTFVQAHPQEGGRASPSRLVLSSVGGEHHAQELAVGLHHAGQRDRVDEADLAPVLHRRPAQARELDQGVTPRHGALAQLDEGNDLLA